MVLELCKMIKKVSKGSEENYQSLTTKQLRYPNVKSMVHSKSEVKYNLLPSQLFDETQKFGSTSGMNISTISFTDTIQPKSLFLKNKSK